MILCAWRNRAPLLEFIAVIMHYMNREWATAMEWSSGLLDAGVTKPEWCFFFICILTFWFQECSVIVVPIISLSMVGFMFDSPHCYFDDGSRISPQIFTQGQTKRLARTNTKTERMKGYIYQANLPVTQLWWKFWEIKMLIILYGTKMNRMLGRLNQKSSSPGFGSLVSF